MDVGYLLHNLGPLSVAGIAQGSIYALFALGYTLVYGVLRLINFAHNEVFMVGTFASLEAWRMLGLTGQSGTPGLAGACGYLVVGLAAAVVVAAVTAVVIEAVAYRPLRRRNAPPLIFLISSIGASMVISESVGIATRRDTWGAPVIMDTSTVVRVGHTVITDIQLLVVAFALIMMLTLDRFVSKTRLGRGIRAVAQNADSAALMGINKARVISLVFLLGGIMAGVASVLYLLKIGDTRYDAGTALGLEAFTAAVLGGIGNLRGALLGGLVLGLAESFGGGLFGTQWHEVVAFVLLVVILLVRPTGLLGDTQIRARA